MPTISNIQRVNSTSYPDVVGLSLGLARLPGEDSIAYATRLYQATTLTRDHSFQGTVNEVALQLGLQVRTGITISSTDAEATIASDINGVHLSSRDVTYDIPLLTIDADDVWRWRFLSEVVTDINAQAPLFTAILQIDDKPSLQLVRQSNVFSVVAETVTGGRMILDNPGIILGTEVFSNPVPSYTISNGVVVFTSEPPSSTTISYKYRVLPYDAVCSEVGMFGLLDSGVSSIAITADTGMVYQLRETLQEVMLRDRSYWAL